MWLLWWALAASGAEPLVLPATRAEIVVESDARPAVSEAFVALEARRFEEAGRLFGALSEASTSADLAYVEAVAWYEAGELRRSRRAVDQALARDAAHAPTLTLKGLVLGDQGQGDKGLAALRNAENGAGDDLVLRGRIALNRALISMDLGLLAKADTYLGEAEGLAQRAGDADLAGRVAVNRAVLAAARGQSGGQDAFSKVHDALRRGDRAQARQALPTAGGSRRDEVRRSLAEGAILRAEGRFDEAAAMLQSAVVSAREGGLDRELAALLAELGAVFRVGGRPALAVDPLEQAVGIVADSSFRMNEVSYRIEAGRVALAMERFEVARGHLARARETARAVEDPAAAPRIDELAGAMAAREGQMGEAESRLNKAWAAWSEGGWHADAARVSVLLVELHAQRASDSVEKTAKRSLAAFEAAGDSLGPVHVSMARGVGLARGKQWAAAMDAFVAAAAAADSVGGQRGAVLGDLARNNAAQVLVSMGQNEQAARAATEHGLSDTVERLRRFESAKESYGSGLKSFEAGDFDAARGLCHDCLL